MVQLKPRFALKKNCMAVGPGAVWLTNGIGSGLSSGEGLIWQVRDPIEQQQSVKEKGRVVDYEKVTTDPGVSDKRLLVIEEEFVRVLASMETSTGELNWSESSRGLA